MKTLLRGGKFLGWKVSKELFDTGESANKLPVGTIPLILEISHLLLVLPLPERQHLEAVTSADRASPRLTLSEHLAQVLNHVGSHFTMSDLLHVTPLVKGLAQSVCGSSHTCGVTLSWGQNTGLHLSSASRCPVVFILCLSLHL